MTEPKKYSWADANNPYDWHAVEGSIEDCIDAARGDGIETILVGEAVDPSPPQECIDSDLIEEAVACSDDYDCEWAEGWGIAQEDREVATDELRALLAPWCEKYFPKPNWYGVPCYKRVDVPTRAKE